MKQMLKLLPVLFVTASCLTSDTTLSSKPLDATQTLSVNSVAFASIIRMPRYSAFPNWGITVYILRKE